MFPTAGELNEDHVILLKKSRGLECARHPHREVHGDIYENPFSQVVFPAVALLLPPALKALGH